MDSLIGGILIVGTSILYFNRIIQVVSQKLNSSTVDANMRSSFRVKEVIIVAFQKYSLVRYAFIVCIMCCILFVSAVYLSGSRMVIDVVVIFQYVTPLVNATMLYLLVHTSFVASTDAMHTFGGIQKTPQNGVRLKRDLQKLVSNSKEPKKSLKYEDTITVKL